MRVAYVTVNFPLNSETFACTDVRVLRELGTDVDVYAMRTRPARASDLLVERGLAGLTVTYNSVAASFRGFVRLLYSPRLALDTVGWLVRHTWRRPAHFLRSMAVLPRSFDILVSIERARPDVVHLFWGHYPAIVGRLVQHLRPRPVCSMFLGAYDLTRGYGPTAAVARTADVVWTHARRNVADIAALGVPGTHVAVAYRGVDLRLFARPNATKVGGRIVSAGRLVRDKKIDHVLAAFQLVLARCPRATLVVLGEGPDRRRLERLAGSLGIAAAVSFRGHVAHAVVRDELRRAQSFITMSQEDGDRLANVVKEAMASCCVPVASATPGIDELISDGISGFIVPPGDTQAAAEKLIELIADPVSAYRMGTLGARHIHQRFDVRRTMAVYLAAWRRLLDAANQPAAHAWRLPAAQAHRGFV